MPASDIGIDLGTRNSLAYSTGKGLVLNEPSIVVYDKNTEKIRAIGEEARMLELADVLEALDDFSLENQEAVVMIWKTWVKSG